MRSSARSSNGRSRRSTAFRVLDIAEDVFAERGFDATSLGDVANRVGIRQPSLYNHFGSKEELYVAVLERLLDPFLEMVEGIALEGSAPEKTDRLIEELMSYYGQHPNLLRLIQHAVLSGSEHIDLLTERWFKPFLEKAQVLQARDEEHMPFVVMAFNSMMMGFVTLAPLYSGMFDMEPLAPQNLRTQIQVLKLFSSTLAAQQIRIP